MPEVVTKAVFVADTTKMMQSMRGVETSLKKIEAENKKVNATAHDASESMSSILAGGIIAGAAVVAAKALSLVASAIKAIGRAAYAAVEFGIDKFVEGVERLDNMADLASSVGATTKQIAGLAVLFERDGMKNGIEAASVALNSYAKAINEAKKGGDAASPFLKMGYTMRKITSEGFTVRNTLDGLFDQFNKLKTAEEKAALAAKLFGRSGRELLPILNASSKAFEAAQADAVKYGTTVSEIGYANIEKSTVLLADMRLKWDGLVNSFASSNIVTDVFQTLVGYFDQLIDGTIDWEAALGGVVPILDWIERSLRNIFEYTKILYASGLFVASDLLRTFSDPDEAGDAKLADLQESLGQRISGYVENLNSQPETFASRFARVRERNMAERAQLSAPAPTPTPAMKYDTQFMDSRIVKLLESIDKNTQTNSAKFGR